MPVSHYHRQASTLSGISVPQLAWLKGTDWACAVREVSKGTTVAGVISIIATPFFGSDSLVPVALTAVSCVTWLLARRCSTTLEPHAKKIIEDLSCPKDIRQTVRKRAD